MGWVLMIGGGIIAVIPGMFQVVNGATLLGVVLTVVGAIMLFREELEGAE